MTADFAAEQLRRGSIRVQGVQRKIDALVQAVTGVLQVLFIVGLVIITYDQLHDHHLLPSWAHIDILDKLAVQIQPYSTHWTILFILFGLYLLRQARRVNRRYREPTSTLPDNRTVE